jgi:GNAT superfamily N-acetyltransferase
MTSDIITFDVRPAKPTDMAFVFDSWLKSYRYRIDRPAAESHRCPRCKRMPPRDINGAAAVEGMRTSDYFDVQRDRIVRLLSRGSTVVVAFPDEPVRSPDVIAAWACYDALPEVLHYVYVDDFYRRKGLARRLIGERRVITHLTDSKRTDSRRPDSFAFIKEKLGLRYVPHLLDGGTP